jgi:hypothetical protein
MAFVHRDLTVTSKTACPFQTLAFLKTNVMQETHFSVLLNRLSADSKKQAHSNKNNSVMAYT